MENYTEKLYNKKPFLLSSYAKVIDIKQNGIILDKTISYPEGGGQIGDLGIINIISKNIELPYVDTQKTNGRTIFLKDFPTTTVEERIIHILEKYEDLKKINIGDKVKICINKKRRIGTTIHHSAIHLALMVLELIQPNINRNIIGCKITTEYGRLDFMTNYKLTQNDLLLIENESNKLINQKIDFLCYSHKEEKDAIYWQCNDYVIPCGGTHVKNSNDLGFVKISRKSIGKNKDRLIVKVQQPNQNFINNYE